ncbi:MAG: hypothetical protein JJ693_03735 [Acidithiobacillus sp.]|nr:hypothetical protein [Acidithiobacillus sp.]
MENRAKLLAALRRVRHNPSYHSFMATQERERIKRQLQRRLLDIRYRHSTATGLAFFRRVLLRQMY